MARTSTMEEKKQELLNQAGAHAEGKLGRDEPATTATTETSATTANASTANAYQRGPATVRLDESKLGASAWYLEETEELAGVTSERKNPTIGVLDIKVYAPSAGQVANGAVANVTVETVIGTIKSIRIEQSQRDHSLLCRPQSRFYEVDGQRNYVNDLELNSKVTAQILRYINTMLVDA